MSLLCSFLRTARILPRTLSAFTPRITGFSNQNRRFESSEVKKVTTPPASVSATVQDKLMEFFEDEKNWGETEIKVGRSWKVEELRIKSNADLHKLWYVLLKERNMLLTMEMECAAKYRLFPNPERLDKVAESMEHLEQVVRERNRAYHLLETGTDGERPSVTRRNQIGLRFKYRMYEHLIPKFMNNKWRETHVHRFEGLAVRKFLRQWRSNNLNAKRKQKNRDKNHVQHLLKRFPDMDMDLLKAEYPSVDVDKAKRSHRARGHFIPKEYQV